VMPPRAFEEVELRQQYLRLTRLVSVFFLVILVVSVTLQVWLAAALMRAWHDPCHMPLRSWAVGTLALWIGKVSEPLLDRAACCWIGGRGEADLPWSVHRCLLATASFLWALMGLCVLALDDAGPDCRRVSPELFSAVRANAWLGACTGLWSAWSTVVLRNLKRRVSRQASAPGAPLPLRDIERHTELAELSGAEIGVTPSCSICLECFAAERVMRITGCGHVFHEGCLRAWLASAASCPLCRQDVARAS